jgi:hypothetical protein
LERIWERKPNLSTEALRRRKYKNKKCEILIGRGHAFGVIDGFNPMTPKPFGQISVREIWQNASLKKQKLKKLKMKNDHKDPILATFDIETTRGSSSEKLKKGQSYQISPYAIGYADNDRGYCYWWGPTCIERFVNFLFSLKSRTYLLYAHNGGNFDFLFVLRSLLKKENVRVEKALDVKSCLVNSEIWIDHEGRLPTVLKFKDSCPLFYHQSLDSLCKNFQTNIKKLTGSVNHDLITKTNFNLYKDQVLKYLKNDVIGLYELLSKAKKIFTEEFEVDIFNCMTISSIARKFFMNKFYQPVKRCLYQIPICLDEIMREAYFGGRTECFKLGKTKGEIYYYDVTSEYPFCMREGMPYGWPIYKREIEEEEEGIFFCRVKGRSSNGINLLPYRSANNGLIFPTFEDYTSGWWWSEEVRLAKKIGYKVKILAGFVFKTCDQFKKPVDFLFNIKQKAKEEKNPTMLTISKIMINSLYGFWATKVKDVSKLIIETNKKRDPAYKYLETMSLLKDTKIGETYVLRVREDLDLNYSYSPLSIACAARARIYLWKIMADITEKGGNIFYCDTDSVITDLKIEGTDLEKKYMKNKGRDLGELKNEFGYENYATDLITIGPKIYGFLGDKVPESMKIPKLKGFYKKFWYLRDSRIDIKNKKAKPQIIYSTPRSKENLSEEEKKIFRTLGFDDLEVMLRGGKIFLTTWRFKTKTRAFFNDFEVRKETAHITFEMNYIKGKVSNDGTMTPWILTSEKELK